MSLQLGSLPLKRTGQNDRLRWLQLLNGGAIKHDTGTSINAFAKATAVSILGYIQLAVLQAMHAAEASGDCDTAGDGIRPASRCCSPSGCHSASTSLSTRLATIFCS